MSIAIMTEVWKDAPVAGTELLMLLALADSANDDRECWPSVRRLCQKTRLSDPQVRKLLKKLIEQKLISKAVQGGRGAKGRESNLYTILHITPITDDKSTPITDDKSTPITDDNLNPLTEPSIEPLSPDGDRKGSEPEASDKADPVPAAQMNPMKDAIARAFRYDWKTMTKTEKGLTQKTARELCLAGVKPEQVASLYRYCEGRFTNFKPGALSGNVSDWRKTVSAKTTLKPEQVGDPKYDLTVPYAYDPLINFKNHPMAKATKTKEAQE